MSDLADLKLQLSTMINHQQNMSELLQSTFTEIARLKAEIALTNQAIVNHKTDVKNAVGEFSKLKDLVATIREEVARNLTSLHQSLLVVIENKVKMIPDLIKKIENSTMLMAKYDQAF